MPELPDLENFKLNIWKKLTSKKVIGFNVDNSRKVQVPDNSSLSDLIDKELVKIDRIGKELFFDFGPEKVLSAHLMLNGEIAIVEPDEVSAIKYKIFTLCFENEVLVFSDKGSLCTIKYNPEIDNVPDALADEFSMDYFKRIAQKKKRSNVKSCLLDQKLVKGIGNAYADEILWEAKISPKSVMGKIPEDKLEIFYNSIGVVLKNAIESIRQIAPDIISGEERSFLKVHNKSLTETLTGEPIIVDKIASKTTYYTAEQIEYL